eukprot:9896045-Ditylum_brightwellii.AAC.1
MEKRECHRRRGLMSFVHSECVMDIVLYPTMMKKKSLRQWVIKQRLLYKRTALSSDCLIPLNSKGFTWGLCDHSKSSMTSLPESQEKI